MVKMQVWTMDELRAEIRRMTASNHSPLYAMLRDELQARGWWKLARRGDPGKGGRVSAAKRKQLTSTQ